MVVTPECSVLWDYGVLMHGTGQMSALVKNASRILLGCMYQCWLHVLHEIAGKEK